MLKLLGIKMLFVSLVLASCSASRNRATQLTVSEPLTNEQYSFPENWMGYWKGELEIFKKINWSRLSLWL